MHWSSLLSNFLSFLFLACLCVVTSVHYGYEWQSGISNLDYHHSFRSPLVSGNQSSTWNIQLANLLKCPHKLSTYVSRVTGHRSQLNIRLYWRSTKVVNDFIKQWYRPEIFKSLDNISHKTADKLHLTFSQTVTTILYIYARHLAHTA